MSLYLLPTGWITPSNDGNYTETHESFLMNLVKVNSALGFLHPVFSFAAGTFRTVLFIENRFFDPSIEEQLPYQTTLGGPYYDCLR